MNSTPSPSYSLVIWLAYTLFGLSITVVAGAFVGILISDANFSLGNFTDGGQFAVYTASMLVGAHYLVNKPAPRRLPFTEWFGIVTIGGVFVASFIMVFGTLVANDFEVNGDAIDPSIYRWPSIGLFVLALSVASFSVFLDNKRMQLDVRNERRKDMDDLSRAVDRVQRGGER